MAIPEAQLDTWAKQGPTQQFVDTYATIRRVLLHPNRPYAGRNSDVYLQGSYCNYTNVYGDSDVDIVICCTDSYYYDLDQLSPAEKDAFNRTLSAGEGLSSDTIRREVLGWLRTNYPNQVTEGKKALSIALSGSRRSADVVPCLVHKRYTRFVSHSNEHHYAGIQFFSTDSRKIVNFPKYHSDNCTTKHQTTNSYFKPMVRIFKRMRNKLINDGLVAEGVAPSYFIEGLLYNVPTDKFGGSFSDTFVNCFNWIDEADKIKLVCANERTYLIRDGFPECWPSANCTTFLKAIRSLWVDW